MLIISQQNTTRAQEQSMVTSRWIKQLTIGKLTPLNNKIYENEVNELCVYNNTFSSCDIGLYHKAVM